MTWTAAACCRFPEAALLPLKAFGDQESTAAHAYARAVEVCGGRWATRRPAGWPPKSGSRLPQSKEPSAQNWVVFRHFDGTWEPVIGTKWIFSLFIVLSAAAAEPVRIGKEHPRFLEDHLIEQGFTRPTNLTAQTRTAAR
jgi:hypothetical protein